MLDAGWEIIACLQGLSVLLYATLLLLPNVQMEKLFVTWDQIVDAGKETTASQRVLFVLLLVTLLFLFNVQKEK